MKWNILQATKRLAFVEKLFTTAKLDMDALIEAGDETALAAHIEAAAPAPVAAPKAPAITAEHPEVAALIAAAVDPLKQQVAAVDAALAAAGIMASAAQPEGFEKAINDRIATKAAEELAKKGVTDFPAGSPSDDPANPKKPAATNLRGRDRYRAAFNAALARN